MPRHKYGKQTQILELKEILSKVSEVSKILSLESLAFFWILYWMGVRKSEAYERTVADCQETEDHFIVDFHQRKKGGAEVPPIELPKYFPGADLLCEQLRKARSRRASRKLIERYHKGVRSTEYVRAQWLFPHVHKQWALQIVKRILGKKYYPHFLRLQRISEICQNPEANIEMIKSYTGIKTIRIIEDNYLGVSRKQQRKAMHWMSEQLEETKSS